MRRHAVVSLVLSAVVAAGLGVVGLPGAGAAKPYVGTSVTASSSRAPRAAGTSGGSITPNGPEVTLDLPAGATVDWTFPAKAGQFVRMGVGEIGGAGWWGALEVSVLGPDDAVLYDQQYVGSQTQLDRATVVRSGQHRLRLTSTSDTDMTVPITLTEGRDTSLTLTPGVATPVSLALPGQQVVQHLVGRRGQMPVLTLTGSTLTGTATMTLRDALGRQVAQSYVTSDTPEVSWWALPGNGAYTITLQGPYGATGSFTETLSLAVPASYRLAKATPTAIAPVADSDDVDLDVWVPAGKTVVLTLDHAQWGPTLAYLFAPDGIEIGSDFLYSPSDSTDFGGRTTFTAGVYHVRLSGALAEGATARVDVAGPVAGGTLALDTPTRASVARAGGSRVLSFSGAAGQRPVFAVSAPTWSGGTAMAYVQRPDGSTLRGFPVTVADPFSELPVLDATGTWTVTIDPDGATTGAVTLSLDLVEDQSLSVTPGTPVHVAVTRPGQNVALHFPGAVGQRPTLRTTGSSWTAPAGEGVGLGTWLYTPGGSTFSSYLYATADGSSYSDADPLIATGTWTLLIDPQDGAVGSADVTLSLVDDVTVPVPRGVATTLAVAQPGQVVTGSVRVPFGFRLTASLRSSSWAGSDGPAPAPRVEVRQSGNEVGSWDFTDTDFVRTDPSPYGATSWSVIVDPQGDVTGSMTLVLDVVRDVVVPLTLGARTTATIAKPGQSVLFTFPGGQGQVLAWSATTSVPGHLVLQDPTGNYPDPLGDVGPDGASGTVTLGSSGGYALAVDADGAQTGTVTVQVG